MCSSDLYYPAHALGTPGAAGSLQGGIAYQIFLFLLDHVQRELLDFSQQLGLHVAQADALLTDFGFGRDVGQVSVLGNVSGNFAERFQAVARSEDVVRPWGVGDNDVPGADVPLDGQLVGARACRTDADVAGRSICSITGGGQVGFHEEPRSIVWARCLIRSAREGICRAPLTRSRMY